LRGRQAEEYDRLRDLGVNREVRAMQMTWAERMEAEYTQKGIKQGLAEGLGKGIEQGLAQGLGKGIEALRNVVLHQMKQRFGSVPETVRSKVEAIQEIEPLSDLAEKVLEVDSIDEMGLS
jgi:flagellar biosynthesis/type III secretory pathway protein FliH